MKMSEKENFEPGTFKIEKNCGCKYVKENDVEKNIDLVLNTQTGKIQNVLCGDLFRVDRCINGGNFNSQNKKCPYKE